MNLKSEYRKQRRRVLAAKNRMIKAGYTFFNFEIPSIPKKITKNSINRLSKITAKELYKKADFINKETGEFEEATEHRNRQRIKSAKKSAERRKEIKAEQNPEYAAKLAYQREESYNNMVIQNYLHMCAHFPAEAYPMIKKWLDNLIQKQGKTAVAEMITTGIENGMMLTSAIAYSGLLDNYLAEMLNYLPDISEQDKRDFTEIMEEDEDGYEVE